MQKAEKDMPVPVDDMSPSQETRFARDGEGVFRALDVLLLLGTGSMCKAVPQPSP